MAHRLQVKAWTLHLTERYNCTMAAMTFHRFSELPAELRDAIWELALPGPARRHPELMSKGGHNHVPTPRSHIKDPMMLRVNRESRAIAMQFYHMRDKYNCPYGKFFNFELDDFYFAGKDLQGIGWAGNKHALVEEDYNMSLADRRRINHITLAFPWSFASCSPFIFVRKAGQAFARSVLIFENVKVVTVEIWQDDALDIMDVMAPRMFELNVSMNRMLRERLTQILEHISEAEASIRPGWEAPTWRIQVVGAGNNM
jgi:hypothetical protein